MSANDAWKLNEVQKAFEHDKHNAERAYDYFIELNKHQFYMNVVQEYQEFDRVTPITERHFGDWANKLTSQYEYAKDHLK